MRSSRMLSLLVVPALLLVACGDGGDDEGASDTTVADVTTTAPDDTTTAPEDDEPDDSGAQSDAEAALLVIGDLPSGWAAKPEAEELDLEPTWQDLLACGDITDPSEGEAASASSPTFLIGVGTQVTSTVAYYDSPERVTELAEALAREDILDCVGDAFLAGLERDNPPEFTFGDVTAAPLEFLGAGETSVGYRVTGTRNISAMSFELFQDFIVVFDGDSISRLFFTNPGEPFAEDLQRTLVETVTERT